MSPTSYQLLYPAIYLSFGKYSFERGCKGI
jgi:hypothetical protein